MVTFNTLAPSPLGSLIYSDYHYKKGEGLIAPARDSFAYQLRRFSFNPVAVIGVGVVRLVLSLLHILYHTLAALSPFSQEGHSYHAAKGGAELLHSIIELIPIVGYYFNDHCYSVGRTPEEDYAFLVRITHVAEAYDAI